MKNVGYKFAFLAVHRTTVACTPTLEPKLHTNPARLASWSTNLRDSQTSEPFALFYANGFHELIFVGAMHDNDPRGATFELIEKSFSVWPVKAVIVEGAPSARGPNSPLLLSSADERLDSDGLQPSGETVPAVRGAMRSGAVVWGGEADDVEVKRFVTDKGVNEADLLGFYVLRVIPQWEREKAISSTADVRLIDLVQYQLDRSRRSLHIDDSVLPHFRDWARWYLRTNGKPIEMGLEDDEAGPLSDGRWPTNRISEIVGRARDADLLRLIAGHLTRYKSVLVVYGASHAIVARPALDAMLGKPCYIGRDIAEASSACKRSSPRKDFK